MKNEDTPRLFHLQNKFRWSVLLAHQKCVRGDVLTEPRSTHLRCCRLINIGSLFVVNQGTGIEVFCRESTFVG